MNDFKEGDTVFYYVRPGLIEESEIDQCHTDDHYRKPEELYHTREEAEVSLSPAGKRMRGCIHEAMGIYDSTLEIDGPADHKRMILDIAFRLFDTEGE